MPPWLRGWGAPAWGAPWSPPPGRGARGRVREVAGVELPAFPHFLAGLNMDPRGGTSPAFCTTFQPPPHPGPARPGPGVGGKKTPQETQGSYDPRQVGFVCKKHVLFPQPPKFPLQKKIKWGRSLHLQTGLRCRGVGNPRLPVLDAYSRTPRKLPLRLPGAPHPW